jgi:hypothetical protein
MEIHTVLPQSYEPYAEDPRYTWIAVSIYYKMSLAFFFNGSDNFYRKKIEKVLQNAL